MTIDFHLAGCERTETNWLLADLNKYLDTMEAALQDTAQLIRYAVRETREQYRDEAEWDQMWREHCRKFDDDFPNKLRYSFLVLTYSYLEPRTKSLCDQLLRRRLVSGTLSKAAPA